MATARVAAYGDGAMFRDCYTRFRQYYATNPPLFIRAIVTFRTAGAYARRAPCQVERSLHAVPLLEPLERRSRPGKQACGCLPAARRRRGGPTRDLVRDRW